MEQAHAALMRRSSSEGAVVFSAFDNDTDAVRRTSGSRTMLRRLSMEGAALAAAAGGDPADFVGHEEGGGSGGGGGFTGGAASTGPIPNFGNILGQKVKGLFDGFDDGEDKRASENSVSLSLSLTHTRPLFYFEVQTHGCSVHPVSFPSLSFIPTLPIEICADVHTSTLS